MRNSILMCLFGGVLGVVLTTASHSVWHQQAERLPVPMSVEGADKISAKSDAKTMKVAEKRTSMSEQLSEDDGGIYSDNHLQASQENSSTTVTLVDKTASTNVDSLGRALPQSHAAMVEPVISPARMTTQELYREFVDDTRDESWAYPMEQGMNEYIQRRGGDLGANFEYVKCASQYCVVAGTIYGGGQSTYDQIMDEMKQGGWWQAYGGNNTTGYSADSEYNFLTILPRNLEDASRTKN